MPTTGIKINIIIVNDYHDVNGGASKIAVTEAVGLAKKGHAVAFFCAVAGVSSALTDAGVKVVCLHQSDILSDVNRFRAVSQGIWNWKAAREFDKLLASCDQSNTIIHLHSWTKSLSSSIVSKVISKGFSVVCTMHDYFLACPNGGFFNYRKSEICTLNALSAKCLLTDCDNRSYLQKCWRIARQVVQRHFGKIPAGINNFIAVSRFSREILKPYLPATANICLLDNPIDMDKFPPVNISDNERFIYVGRISAEKGCLLFAAAVKQLAVPASFIGDGALRKRVLQIAPGSTVTGWLQHDQLLDAMQSARALVFPSLLYETQGLVVMEAMARGIPVIVADTSAAREMVVNRVTGLWFKGGDLTDLVKVIKMMATPGIAEQMGQAAYDAYWAAPPTIERHVGQLELCYRDILAKRQECRH
jgi:glycosyltransferase involved in cell wall biosynthesis